MQKRLMPQYTNQLAAMVVKLATCQRVEPEPEAPAKNPAAVELRRLGGKARKTKLPKARRSEIARKAVNARLKRHRQSRPK